MLVSGGVGWWCKVGGGAEFVLASQWFLVVMATVVHVVR